MLDQPVTQQRPLEAEGDAAPATWVEDLGPGSLDAGACALGRPARRLEAFLGWVRLQELFVRGGRGNLKEGSLVEAWEKGV